MPGDSGEELRPATREELLEGLSFAMRYQGRRRVRDDHADSFMARIAAEHLMRHLLMRHLRLSRFVYVTWN